MQNTCKKSIQETMKNDSQTGQSYASQEQESKSQITKQSKSTQSSFLQKQETDHSSSILQETVENYYSSVGFLKSFWRNKQGKIVTYNCGSAFALTSRIIMTCTHNIYAEGRQQFCSQVKFYPNYINESISGSIQHFKAYASIQQNFYKCLDPNNSFASRPIKGQVCLIVLKEPLEYRRFASVGNISNKSQFFTNKPIQIMGYPSNHHYRCEPIRNHLKGQIIGIDKHIIQHNCRTKKGVSGSSIMVEDDDGWKAIGIHTHKGQQGTHNCGIYFTNELINMIKQFERQLSISFALEESIKYRVEDFSCNEQKDVQKQLINYLRRKQQEDQVVQNTFNSRCKIQRALDYQSRQPLDENDSKYYIEQYQLYCYHYQYLSEGSKQNELIVTLNNKNYNDQTQNYIKLQ